MESQKQSRRARPQQTPDTAQSDEPRVRRSLLTKKAAIISGAIVIIIATSLAVYRFNSSDRPSYQTVLPDGKSAEELGGWKRISPADKDPVFAYADKIGDVSISVSQQPLPGSFKTETARQVTELAKSYNATTKITADDITAYVGTSSKGPQSVIFAKKGLLILIKSHTKVENAAWESYIRSLGNPGGGGIPKY